MRRGYGVQTRAQGSALALVDFVMAHGHPRILGAALGGGKRPVGRAVVDDYDLLDA